MQEKNAKDIQNNKLTKDLLEKVSKSGLGSLDIAELMKLSELLQKKEYEDRRAQKSKKKLLNKINAAIYDRAEK